MNPRIGICHRCRHRQSRCAGPCACTVSGRDIIDHAEKGDCPNRYFAIGLPRPKLRGLGDVVAAVTSAVGITPCGKCKQRQEALNRIVPFGSD
jgi:hypothetical protein